MLVVEGYSALCCAQKSFQGPVAVIYDDAVPPLRLIDCGFSSCWRGARVRYGYSRPGSFITWARYLAVPPFTMLRCMLLRKHHLTFLSVCLSLSWTYQKHTHSRSLSMSSCSL